MKNLIVIIGFFVAFSFVKGQKNVFDVARNGTVEELKALIKQDQNIINTVNENGYSPLILACYRGNTDVARFLIDQVKDINYQSKDGTALSGLSIRYQKELVLALLDKKADPNIADVNGTTPLIWAVKTGNEELVKLLLDHKADPKKADNSGVKPFEYAMQTQKPNIINLLKSK